MRRTSQQLKQKVKHKQYAKCKDTGTKGGTGAR